MGDLEVICPSCGATIPLTDALTNQLQEQIQERLQSDFKQGLAVAVARAEAKGRADVALDLSDLQSQVRDANEKLGAMQEQELALRREKRRLEEARKELELDVERRLDAERQDIEQGAEARAAEAHHIKDLEKDRKLQELTKQIDELKRRAEQGSQQMQGEAVEIELEEMLGRASPHDRIEPVPKGIRGADVVQRVYHPSGNCCGTIVWESKNTKNWNDTWLEKLKEDQRSVRGECAVLLSIALPPTVKHFGEIDGIWVTDLACAVALASALRSSLVFDRHGQSVVGRQEREDGIPVRLCVRQPVPRASPRAD